MGLFPQNQRTKLLRMMVFWGLFWFVAVSVREVDGEAKPQLSCLASVAMGPDQPPQLTIDYRAAVTATSPASIYLRVRGNGSGVTGHAVTCAWDASDIGHVSDSCSPTGMTSPGEGDVIIVTLPPTSAQELRGYTVSLKTIGHSPLNTTTACVLLTNITTTTTSTTTTTTTTNTTNTTAKATNTQPVVADNSMDKTSIVLGTVATFIVTVVAIVVVVAYLICKRRRRAQGQSRIVFNVEPTTAKEEEEERVSLGENPAAGIADLTTARLTDEEHNV